MAWLQVLCVWLLMHSTSLQRKPLVSSTPKKITKHFFTNSPSLRIHSLDYNYYLFPGSIPPLSQISMHQTFMINCLLYIFSWTSPRHLQLNISNRDFIMFTPPLPVLPPMSVTITAIHPVSQARVKEVFLTLLPNHQVLTILPLISEALFFATPSPILSQL